MSRYRLQPLTGQAEALREHCAHARYVWNLAVEQQAWWRPGRTHAPGFAEQSRQLTEARAAFEWLRDGSIVVQQQALRDFAQALQNFFRGTHGRPTWRKVHRSEGFRIVAFRREHVRRLSRRVGEVRVPKVGWIRFRWSRAIPEGVKSYRITLDRSGRWHIAFASIPEPIPAPHTGDVVGLDRGVVVSAALSSGELLRAPGLSAGRQRRLQVLQRRLARAERGSNRRAHVRLAVAKLRVREADARKDWIEKTTTDLARRFDVIRIEQLSVSMMTHSAKGTVSAPGRHVRQKAALNRGILASGWGMLQRRLEEKAPGRVEKVSPAFTSQRCSACGHVDRKSRESQAVFRCTACGYATNADVNAACNIAAGHAVTARGGERITGPANREPQLLAS